MLSLARSSLAHATVSFHTSVVVSIHRFITGMFKKYVANLVTSLDCQYRLEGKISTDDRHCRPNSCQVFCSTRHPIDHPFLMEDRRRDARGNMAKEGVDCARKVVSSPSVPHITPPCLALHVFISLFFWRDTRNSREHLSIYALHGEPLFFQHFDGPYFPTLRLLHKCEFPSFDRVRARAGFFFSLTHGIPSFFILWQIRSCSHTSA